MSPKSWGGAAGVRIVGVLALLSIGFGTWGWLQAVPGLPFLEALYRAIQLLTLSMAEQATSWQLEIARWLGVIVAFMAVAQILLAVFTKRMELWSAQRRSNHQMLVGNGPEVAELAKNLAKNSGDRVVVVGDLSPDDHAELEAHRIPVFAGLSDAKLVKILRGAQRVIVIGDSDVATTNQLRRVSDEVGVTPVTVLDSPSLVRQWNRIDTATRPVCRVTQVAIEALRQCPPFPSDAAVPDPIVIGDGELAAELVRRIITGWQRDGWFPRVHCLTTSAEWTDELVHQFRSETIQTHVMTLAPACVKDKVRDLVRQWQPPNPGKGTAQGVRAYVALEDSQFAAAIAMELLDDGETHVGLIVDRQANWEELFKGFNERAQLISRDLLLADPKVLGRSEADLLCDQITADATEWPSDALALFGEEKHDGEGNVEIVARQDLIDPVVAELTRHQARLALAIIKAGGLTATVGTPMSAPPMVGPMALVAMREVFLNGVDTSPQRAGRALPDDDSDPESRRPPITIEGVASLLRPEASPQDRDVWALELVARLPEMIQRSGWVVTSNEPSIQSDLQINEMAKFVHFAYMDAQDQLGNPTGSELATKAWETLSEFEKAGNRAVVLDFPVKLASLGLDWTRDPAAPGYDLTPSDIEVLAFAEHRRWCRFVRRHGRTGHYYNRPWEELTSGAQQLDVVLVKKLPAIFAKEGIRMVAPNPRRAG